MIYKNVKMKKFSGMLNNCMVFNVTSPPLDLVNGCALLLLRYAHFNPFVLNCYNLSPYSLCACQEQRSGVAPERRFPKYLQNQ